MRRSTPAMGEGTQASALVSITTRSVKSALRRVSKNRAFRLTAAGTGSSVAPEMPPARR
jgi:hypothetical protein